MTTACVQHGMDNLLTFKLHLIAHHLPDPELNLGPASRTLEFWIERMIQYMKRVVRGRATHLEAIFWGDKLLHECLRGLFMRTGKACAAWTECPADPAADTDSGTQPANRGDAADE